MRHLLFAICIFLLLSITSLFAQNEASEQDSLAPRIFFLPGLSYEYTAFGDVKFHDPSASINMIRFNPAQRDRMFVVSLRYNPNIVYNNLPDYPNLYHNISLSVMQRIDRRMFTAAFMPMTDKPLFGGTRSYMGMAMYSYHLIRGEHFSMNLGFGLFVMDIGVALDNGTPWMVWPVPLITLSWEYEWFTLSVMPAVRLVVAPKKPVNLIVVNRFREYDASLWYRFFRDGKPSAEIMGIAFGVKHDSNSVSLSDGRRYRLSYDAVYGAVRLFRILEINGGWAFNGKDEEGKREWDAVFSSFGYSGRSMTERKIGSGFFLSVSARLSPGG